MAKIAYADKVAGAAAPQGKGRAVDFNEIKTSVNALYDEVDAITVPTKTSDLTNDSDFIVDADYTHTDNNYSDADVIAVSAIADKVDKESGKGLSTNDLTNDYKNLLDFNTTASSAYNTEIPLNKALTVMTGKSLTSNDTFTILANPVNEAACKVVLVGDGSHSPVFTNFDEMTGTYDTTNGVKNVILFYRSESVNYVVISQTTSV